jgi:hypothetical protein
MYPATIRPTRNGTTPGSKPYSIVFRASLRIASWSGAGITTVGRYAGGLLDWEEVGLALEGSSA